MRYTSRQLILPGAQPTLAKRFPTLMCRETLCECMLSYWWEELSRSAVYVITLWLLIVALYWKLVPKWSSKHVQITFDLLEFVRALSPILEERNLIRTINSPFSSKTQQMLRNLKCHLLKASVNMLTNKWRPQLVGIISAFFLFKECMWIKRTLLMIAWTQPHVHLEFPIPKASYPKIFASVKGS